jgi:alginate O-acetyltransferase complex protein AlgI
VLFNSYPFVCAFLPVVVLGFSLLARWQARKAALAFLILASLFFYAWWDWRFLALILFSVLFNFSLGAGLQQRAGSRGSRPLLILGVVVNLGLLAYFKYRNFLLDSLAAALGTGWQLPALVLPLAISFFTFEQITYLVDAYHGDTGRYDFLSYVLFITFFPHLIAGPIVRYKDIVPQFTRGDTFRFNEANVATGLLTFAIGLFKKVMIADTFSPWVAPIFDRLAVVGFSDAWGATLAFALQLYFDFSAYSDMAVGLALMLNIRLPENFDSPYQAQSIIDFWRRWHMTLSNFLRDYLYVPLGGNRKGSARRYCNLFITMLLGGLWHGANSTFIVWGGLHGCYVAINHWWRRGGIRLPAVATWSLTFMAVLVAWVFFRAPSFGRARIVLAGMAGLGGFAWHPTDHSIGRHELKRLLFGLAMVLWCPNRRTLLEWRWQSDYVYAVAFALLAGISILRLGDPSPFLYFQF